jgi:hypothetical protein
MSDDTPALFIPPTEIVRERLAHLTAESRLLRKLLRVAKSRDQVRPTAERTGLPAIESEAVPCK